MYRVEEYIIMYNGVVNDDSKGLGSVLLRFYSLYFAVWQSPWFFLFLVFSLQFRYKK